jgi:predicted transporter
LELQSLIMGLLVAVLAFAVKTGLGWAYLWQRRGRGRRLWPTLSVLVLYAGIFALVLFLVQKIDLLANYQLIEPLWRGGQTVHWLIALMLFAWGLILMRHQDHDPVGLADPEGQDTGGVTVSDTGADTGTGDGLDNLGGLGEFDEAIGPEVPGCLDCRGPVGADGSGPSGLERKTPAGDGSKKSSGSYGFLALIIPCPVCLSVVTMSLACLVLYFPDQALQGTAILYAGFTAVAAAAGLALIYGLLGRGENLERSLGLAMTTIAAYFMISALVLPQFGQIDRVYRLASYAEESEKSLPLSGFWLVAGVAALALLGFLVGRAKIGWGGKGA